MKAPSFFYKHAALGSLSATATNAIALFVVFRLAYQHLGPDVMGMWALVQGIMLISRLSDMGSSGNITRLLAIERLNCPDIKLRNFIMTGLLVSTLPVSLLGLLIFFPTYYYAKNTLVHGIESATLFYFVASSLLFGTMSSVGAVLAGCLDGLGLMALRGYLFCIANITLVVLAHILIYVLGDIGLGFAYVAYSLILTGIIGIALLLLSSKQKPVHPQVTIRELARKSIRFNAGFFAIGVCRLMLDPTCKVLLSTYSTLEYVAIFDLANKVTTQVRIFFSSALYSILPHVSRETHNLAPSLYEKLLYWNESATSWALYLMSALVLLSGPLSAAALGASDSRFVYQVIVLSFANAVNITGIVGYYLEVGSGNVRRLFLIHAVMAFINVILGATFGFTFGAIGVTVGLSIALAYAGLACSNVLLSAPRSFVGYFSHFATQFGVFFLSSSVSVFGIYFGTYASLPLKLVPNVAALVLLFLMFTAKEGRRFLAMVRNHTSA